jgi:hypothetical protein
VSDLLLTHTGLERPSRPARPTSKNRPAGGAVERENQTNPPKPELHHSQSGSRAVPDSVAAAVAGGADGAPNSKRGSQKTPSNRGAAAVAGTVRRRAEDCLAVEGPSSRRPSCTDHERAVDIANVYVVLTHLQTAQQRNSEVRESGVPDQQRRAEVAPRPRWCDRRAVPLDSEAGAVFRLKNRAQAEGVNSRPTTCPKSSTTPARSSRIANATAETPTVFGTQFRTLQVTFVTNAELRLTGNYVDVFFLERWRSHAQRQLTA